jgi:PAS domain S-box-containing protein
LILDINRSFEEITGYLASEVIGKTTIDLGIWAKGTDRQGVGVELAARGEVRGKEFEFRGKSGKEVTALFYAEILTIENEQIVLSSSIDISERKQAEEELRSSEARMRQAQRLGRLGFWEWNIATDKTVWSDEMFAIYGITPEEFTGRGEDYLNFTHPDDRLIQRENIRKDFELAGVRARTTGDLVDTHPDPKEFRISRKDGSVCYVRGDAVEVVDAEGKPVRMYGILQNVTESRQAEILLRQSEERYKLMFQSAPLAINITRDTVITYANSSYMKMFGYASLEELQRLAPAELFVPEYRPQILENIVRRTQGLPVPDYYEAECLRKDGTRFPILMYLTRTIFADGPATVAFVLDITERRRAEASLARQTAELERLYRASESLLFSSTYDLQSLAKTIVEVVLRVFGQDNCSVFLINKDSNQINRLAVAGPYADKVKKIALTSDGPGQVAQAIRSGQVINTPDVRAASVYIPNWEDARAELTIPLKVGDQVIGALDVQSAEPEAFTAEDERLMLIFAERAALALERGQLNEELEHQVQQLTSLRTIDMAISSSVDIKLILGILLDQLIKQLGVDAADILLFDPRLQMFQFAVAQGFRNPQALITNLRLDDGGASRALRERRIVLIRDLNDAPSEAHRKEGFVSFVGVPLIAKGQVKGVLEIFQRSPFDLNPQQRAFLEILSGQAAIAIDNTQLFENLQGSNEDLMMAYDETIEGWSRAMDLRDKETEGHTRRVTEMTQQLAISMGFAPEELMHIRRGALLHDIGKIGVPDEILRKPGPLTDDEWIIMHRHPQLAYDMLSPIIYLQPALDIPYGHHERWDGTGYPRGLKGEQIPLVARIFAVIDVWDALISPRPYREAMSETQARDYIQEQSGLHFDPVVVKNFLNMRF